MAVEPINISRKQIPVEGVHISLPAGKVLTRIHLDLAQDGLTLSHVGAASSALKPGNRQRVVLNQAKEGISLAMVGAASAAK